MNASLNIGQYIEQAFARLDEAELAYGHGTVDAFDDAVFMVLETLGLPPDALDENYERELTAEEIKKLDRNINARIETRKPAPYILNRAYIQGIPFYVDENVIVPRSFIGEILCQEDGFSKIENIDIKNVLDLCTGSGCLAILAGHLFPEAQIDAVELSPGAAAVARRNIDESGFSDRITLYEGDLLKPVAGKKYDLIIANPPYVDAQTVANMPAEHKSEPEMAFLGGKDGLDLVRVILAQVSNHLNDGGGMICEIGQGQAILERDYKLPFLWLDTEFSEGEVFWLTKKQLMAQ